MAGPQDLFAPPTEEELSGGSGQPPGVSAQFDTILQPAEEQNFQQWKTQYAPNDSGADYDLRGAYKAGLKPSPKNGHWPDTFKKPNHPTFSDQSKYAQYGSPGSWNGDTFVPNGGTGSLPTPGYEEFFAPPTVDDITDTSPVSPTQFKVVKGMSDEEIAKGFHYDLERIKQSPFYKPGMLSSLVEDPVKVEGHRGGTLVHEALDTVEGAEQFGERVLDKAARAGPTSGTMYTPTVELHALHRLVRRSNQLHNRELGRRVVEGQEEPAMTPEAFVGQMIVPTPGGKLKAGKGVAEMAKQAAIGGVLSPQDVTAPEVGSEENNYLSTAATRGGVGAALGATLGAVVKGGTKLVNAGLKIPFTSKALPSKKSPSVDTDFIRRAEEEKVPFLLGHVYPDKTSLRGAESFITPNAKKVEIRQAAETAAQERVRLFQDDMLATKFRTAKDLRARAAAGDKEAKELVERLNKPSDDWSDNVDLSGKLEVFNAKVKAERMYAAVDKAGAGIVDIPQHNLEMALQTIQAKRFAESSKGVDDDYVAALKGLEVAAAQSPIPTFRDARIKRAGLANIQAGMAAMAAKNGHSSAALAEDFAALRAAAMEDMRAAANSARKPDAAHFLEKADLKYADVAKVKDSKLAGVLEKKPELADEILNEFTLSADKGGRDRAKLLYNSLGERGRAAVRYRLVDRAFQNAHLRGDFSPQAFASEMEAVKPMFDVMLAGNDKFQMKGFTKFLEHLHGIGPSAADINAERMTRAGMGAGGVAVNPGSSSTSTAGIWATVGQIIGSRGASWFLNSKGMQKFWMAASDLAPGSKGMGNLIESEFLKQLSREVGRSGGEPLVEQRPLEGEQ